MVARPRSTFDLAPWSTSGRERDLNKRQRTAAADDGGGNKPARLGDAPVLGEFLCEEGVHADSVRGWRVRQTGGSARGCTPSVELRGVHPENIDSLRTLNMSLLPIRFPCRLYKDMLRDPKLCRLAYCGTSAVGAVAARIEIDRATRARTGSLYVMSLVVVAPHRRMGVGRALLAHLIYTVREDPDFHDIDRLELHVHASNEDALAFYSASGFEDVHELQNYYPRLDPPHARLLRLRV